MSQVNQHTLSCVVKNQAGVLAAIAASFAAKGVNIISVTAGEMANEERSRMTIVVQTEAHLLADVVAHLETSEYVIEVDDLEAGSLIERELMLIRVRAKDESIPRVMQLVEIFRATVVGMGDESLTIEMSGQKGRVEALINLLSPYGIIEVVRTGRVAIGLEEEGGSAA